MTSIYIPRISVSVSELCLTEELTELGQVNRVDFVPLNKKPGFVEMYDSSFRSAFVHFHNYNNTTTIEIFEKLGLGQSYKFFPKSINEYWLLLKAKNPVQQTMMNNSQIVENCRYLEKLLEDQQETIKNLEDRLERTQQTVYQLIGGLYNKSNQIKSIDEHISILYPEYYPEITSEDTSKWEMWPTTRQGDYCERRIENLEEKINTILQRFNFNNNSTFKPDYDDELEDELLLNRKYTVNSDASSVHSSMPDLIDMDTLSTHSSMPDLIDIDTLSTHSSMQDLEEKNYINLQDFE
jgi:hypothetical protein